MSEQSALAAFVAKVQNLAHEAGFAEMAGAVWCLNRKAYSVAGYAKRYAGATLPLAGCEAGHETIFDAAPGGQTHAHLVLGTAIIETLNLPAYEAGERIAIKPAQGWFVEAGQQPDLAQ